MASKLFLTKIIRFVSEVKDLESVNDVIEEEILRPLNDSIQRVLNWTNDASLQGLPVWLGPSGVSTVPRQKTIAFATTLDNTYNYVLCDAKTVAFTVTLPPLLTSIGYEYHIMKIDATENIVTIDAGSEIISDFATGNNTTLDINGKNVSSYLVGTAINEVQALTLAGTATASGTVTITLNGTAFAIEITGGGGETLTQVATEIATKIFAGWKVSSSGGVVIFVSNATGPLTGTFSFVDTDTTSVTGTLAESTSGASVWMVH